MKKLRVIFLILVSLVISRVAYGADIDVQMKKADATIVAALFQIYETTPTLWFASQPTLEDAERAAARVSNDQKAELKRILQKFFKGKTVADIDDPTQAIFKNLQRLISEGPAIKIKKFFIAMEKSKAGWELTIGKNSRRMDEAGRYIIDSIIYYEHQRAFWPDEKKALFTDFITGKDITPDLNSRWAVSVYQFFTSALFARLDDPSDTRYSALKKTWGSDMAAWDAAIPQQVKDLRAQEDAARAAEKEKERQEETARRLDHCSDGGFFEDSQYIEGQVRAAEKEVRQVFSGCTLARGYGATGAGFVRTFAALYPGSTVQCDAGGTFVYGIRTFLVGPDYQVLQMQENTGDGVTVTWHKRDYAWTQDIVGGNSAVTITYKNGKALVASAQMAISSNSKLIAGGSMEMSEQTIMRLLNNYYYAGACKNGNMYSYINLLFYDHAFQEKVFTEAAALEAQKPKETTKEE